VEDINWLYQIINWGVSILVTPLITFFITWYKMRKQHSNELTKLFERHKNELEKIERQHKNELNNLKRVYTNERNSKINDLKIQKLIELHDMLSKEATSINYISHANLSYFHKLLSKETEANDNTWEEHNKSILENEKTKVNYIPQIRNRLLLLPTFKSKFKNEKLEVDSKKYNYIDFDLAIKYNKPKFLFEKAKNDNLQDVDIDEYTSFSQRYFDLIESLIELIEKEIEEIIENDTEIK